MWLRKAGLIGNPGVICRLDNQSRNGQPRQPLMNVRCGVIAGGIPMTGQRCCHLIVKGENSGGPYGSIDIVLFKMWVGRDNLFHANQHVAHIKPVAGAMEFSGCCRHVNWRPHCH